MSKNPFCYKVAECIKTALSQNPLLEKLVLSNCSLMWASCSQILSGLMRNRNLKFLDLSDNDCSKSTKATIWSELFKANHSIQTLVFNNCKLGVMQTCELVRNFHNNDNLRALLLSNNDIEDITLKSLGFTIEEQKKFLLTKLDISDNYKISDSVAAGLFTKMSECRLF